MTQTARPAMALVDGEGATGKMLVHSLLDGHPLLSILPFHDSLADGLCDWPDDVPWLAQRDTSFLRSILSRTLYYDLERFSLRGAITLQMGGADDFVRPLEFDFGRFDAEWMETLARDEAWTPALILERIHAAFRQRWQPAASSPPRALVSVGTDRRSTAERVPHSFPDWKLIYTVRDVVAIVAARVARRPLQGDARSEATLLITADSMIASGKVRRIVERQATARMLAKTMPERVLTVDFDALMFDREQAVRSLCAFLDIDWAPSMMRASLAGTDIVSESGRRYDGPPLDTVETLSPDVRERLQAEIQSAELALSTLLETAR